MHFYASWNDDVLPQTSSEDWAGRVPESEKWRQMGIDACTKVLTKAMARRIKPTSPATKQPWVNSGSNNQQIPTTAGPYHPIHRRIGKPGKNRLYTKTGTHPPPPRRFKHFTGGDSLG
jgi:hypothetical protein